MYGFLTITNIYLLKQLVCLWDFYTCVHYTLIIALHPFLPFSFHWLSPPSKIGLYVLSCLVRKKKSVLSITHDQKHEICLTKSGLFCLSVSKRDQQVGETINMRLPSKTELCKAKEVFMTMRAMDRPWEGRASLVTALSYQW